MRRMMYDKSFLGQVMTLTLGQSQIMTFMGHIVHHSPRHDETNVMTLSLSLYLK